MDEDLQGEKLEEIPESSKSKQREDVEEKDEVATEKVALNRSVSCGSILQGNAVSKMRNLTRRVSFPADDKLISGYNEPRNPWEHAHGTTTEDLIQAYTQSCQSWNVRPITKLLLQLQEISDFTVRADSLTLKGEKLEMRVVETLESIFKRVQFVTIDLEATNLDEDAGASLFDMIEYYESAVNVLAGFNKNLGTRGWQAAAHMMRKMSCLRLFDGHSVPLSIQASPFVGRALRLSNTLVTLHLENAMLTGRPLLLIVAALRMNTTLKELFLADNRFAPLDALQLANLLKFNRILQLLDLRNNPIQDLGVGHLCAGLMAQSGSTGLNGAAGGLQTLVLWNNQISHEGTAKLAMALRYTVSLSTINLGQNVLGDDGILILKEGLLQNHSLLRLGLVGTKLTDEGAVAIAEYLAESPRIIRLDLRNNNIRVAGLMALSLAFKINNSLLRLDIDKPNKKDALKELAAKQESLLNDIVSYAARNKQAALEKSMAAQARQEEARRSKTKDESELRYMDMTNASTSTTSDQTSANNSNNQSPDAKHKVLVLKGATPTKVQGIYPTVTPDADDTPEDSPEFLPRSSVSYHQVAPVMLSNSEIAKRAAAAAKLVPVREQGERGLPNDLKSGDGAFFEIGDVCTVAMETIGSDGMETCDQDFPAQERSIHPALDATNASLDSIDITDPSPSQRQENLDIFAAKLTEVVLTNATVPQAASGSDTSCATEEPGSSNLEHTNQQNPTSTAATDQVSGNYGLSHSTPVSTDENVIENEFIPTGVSKVTNAAAVQAASGNDPPRATEEPGPSKLGLADHQNLTSTYTTDQVSGDSRVSCSAPVSSDKNAIQNEFRPVEVSKFTAELATLEDEINGTKDAPNSDHFTDYKVLACPRDPESPTMGTTEVSTSEDSANDTQCSNEAHDSSNEDPVAVPTSENEDSSLRKHEDSRVASSEEPGDSSSRAMEQSLQSNCVASQMDQHKLDVTDDRCISTATSGERPPVDHSASSTKRPFADHNETRVEDSAAATFDTERPLVDNEGASLGDAKQDSQKAVARGTTGNEKPASIGTRPSETLDPTAEALSAMVKCKNLSETKPTKVHNVVAQAAGDGIGKNEQILVSKSCEEFPLSEEDAAIQNLVALATESTSRRHPVDQPELDVLLEGSDSAVLNAERSSVEAREPDVDVSETTSSQVEYRPADHAESVTERSSVDQRNPSDTDFHQKKQDTERPLVDQHVSNTVRPPVDQSKSKDLKEDLRGEITPRAEQNSVCHNAALTPTDDVSSCESKPQNNGIESLEPVMNESHDDSKPTYDVLEELQSTSSPDDSNLAEHNAVIFDSQSFESTHPPDDSESSHDDLLKQDSQDPLNSSTVTQIGSGIPGKSAPALIESLSEDITGGFEDNSIISGDLSPLEDRIIDKGVLSDIADKTGLLTPDSGVVQFMRDDGKNVATHKSNVTCGSQDEEISVHTSHASKNELQDFKKVAEFPEKIDASGTKSALFLPQNEAENSQNQNISFSDSNFVDNTLIGDKNTAENEICGQDCDSTKNTRINHISDS